MGRLVGLAKVDIGTWRHEPDSGWPSGVSTPLTVGGAPGPLLATTSIIPQPDRPAVLVVWSSQVCLIDLGRGRYLVASKGFWLLPVTF
jgi:hypothetical protein